MPLFQEEMPRKSLLIQHGGELLGKGGFGEVYSSVEDIGALTHVRGFDKTNAKDSTLNNCVFKLVHESKDLYTELENNAKVHELFAKAKKSHLTSLHPSVASVDTSADELIVYRRFDGDLESTLFVSEETYTREWKAKPVQMSNPTMFVRDCILRMLEFCAVLHANGYIHKDIKADNVLVALQPKPHVVIGDYGFMMPMTEDNSSTQTLFEGMPDYMPPFCHFLGNKRPVIENYIKASRSRFLKSEQGRSKHPPINVDVFEEVAKTYADSKESRYAKEKIDLHATGIVLLQLLARFELTSKAPELVTLAQDLMKNNNVFAPDAIKRLKKPSSTGSLPMSVLASRRGRSL